LEFAESIQGDALAFAARAGWPRAAPRTNPRQSRAIIRDEKANFILMSDSVQIRCATLAAGNVTRDLKKR
jgi:hypothetical protein